MLVLVLLLFVCFFKQKTAYEMRISDWSSDVCSSDLQASRGQLRKYGVRFGGYSIFMPALLKPAPARALLTLWALTRKDVADPFEGLPQPPTPGLTSVPADPAAPAGFYDAPGFRVCGGRAVRLDMLERIADLIRPVITARSYKHRKSTRLNSSHYSASRMPSSA